MEEGSNSSQGVPVVDVDENIDSGQQCEFFNESQLKGPKMSPFDDKLDAMDAYLHRFEQYAELQGWRRDGWTIYLAALLKGKTLDVYS